MKDGQGNLIAPNGRLYAPWSIRFGRDFTHGPNAIGLAIYWGLRNDAQPGELVYDHEFRLNLFWFRR
jgi:hypothetical protein